MLTVLFYKLDFLTIVNLSYWKIFEFILRFKKNQVFFNTTYHKKLTIVKVFNVIITNVL